jgi:hypothetical protein
MTTAVHVIDVRLTRPGRAAARRLSGRITAFMRWTALRAADIGAAGQLGPVRETTIGRATGARA